MVRWTQARAENIATRSYRYLDAIDIKVGWADEAARPGRQPVRSGAATRRHTMATRPETEIDRLLEPTANEYVDEERAAAEEESHDAAASAVFSVRLSPATYDAVRAVAAKAHLTPSAVIRQWVTQRVEETGATDDLATAIAALRHDVDRVANLVRPT